VDFTLRPIHPSDSDELVRHWATLSPESQRRRFLTSKPVLSPSELRFLTDVDFVDHVAWVATPADDPARILGVGRFVRLEPGGDLAEFASALAAKLVEEALPRGVRRFTATIFSDNRAVRRVMERIASRLEYDRRYGSVDELVFSLAA
jgi:RimJ/RimL family protein N-acetyltransferase